MIHTVLKYANEIHNALPYNLLKHEVQSATSRLSHNKAIGLDGLPDRTIHMIASIKSDNDERPGIDFLH